MQVRILPASNIISFWAKPIRSHPIITNGTETKMIFLLPIILEKIPPGTSTNADATRCIDANHDSDCSLRLKS